MKKQRGQKNPPLKSKKHAGLKLMIAAVLLAGIFSGLSLFARVRSEQVREQNRLGYQYFAELPYEQAIAAFQEALGIEPKDASALEGMTESYSEWAEAAVGIGDIGLATDILRVGYESTQAQELLSRSEELEALANPETAKEMIELGDFYSGEQQYDMAYEVYREAYKLDSGDPALMWKIAKMFFARFGMSSMYEQALAGYEMFGG